MGPWAFPACRVVNLNGEWGSQAEWNNGLVFFCLFLCLFWSLSWSEYIWRKINETSLQIYSLGLFTHIYSKVFCFVEFSDAQSFWGKDRNFFCVWPHCLPHCGRMGFAGMTMLYSQGAFDSLIQSLFGEASVCMWATVWSMISFQFEQLQWTFRWTPILQALKSVACSYSKNHLSSHCLIPD